MADTLTVQVSHSFMRLGTGLAYTTLSKTDVKEEIMFQILRHKLLKAKAVIFHKTLVKILKGLIR